MKSHLFEPKSFNIVIVSLFAFLLPTGCSKKNSNNNSPPPVTTVNSLIGKWYTDTVFLYNGYVLNGSVYVPNKVTLFEFSDTSAFYHSQFIQFNSNASAYSNLVDVNLYINDFGAVNYISDSASYKLYDDSVLVENFNSGVSDTSIIYFRSSNSFLLQPQHILSSSTGYYQYYFFK